MDMKTKKDSSHSSSYYAVYKRSLVNVKFSLTYFYIAYSHLLESLRNSLLPDLPPICMLAQPACNG